MYTITDTGHLLWAINYPWRRRINNEKYCAQEAVYVFCCCNCCLENAVRSQSHRTSTNVSPYIHCVGAQIEFFLQCKNISLHVCVKKNEEPRHCLHKHDHKKKNEIKLKIWQLMLYCHLRPPRRLNSTSGFNFNFNSSGLAFQQQRTLYSAFTLIDRG